MVIQVEFIIFQTLKFNLEKWSSARVIT
jgi:hypothetical protein